MSFGRTGQAMGRNVFLLFVAAVVAVLGGCVRPAFLGHVLALPRSAWRSQVSAGSTIQLTGMPRVGEDVFDIRYEISPGGGYVQILADTRVAPSDVRPFAFRLQACSDGVLEVKFEDRDGTVFGHRCALSQVGDEWQQIALYWGNFEYWWGRANDRFGRPVRVFIAVSGTGKGTLSLADVQFGPEGLPASFPFVGPHLDPDRHVSGLGFRQRRDECMAAEDPLVLEWLKREQDVSSPEGHLVGTMGEEISHTFNNALVAMAFVLKGERERAERILDFYAGATDRANTVPAKQNFFVNGEPRGFFQAVRLRGQGDVPAYHEPGGTDRWMGDMAWLLSACEHYRRTCRSSRYEELACLLEELLVSFYIDAADAPGGYVRHGWRKGDTKLHEADGHPEGNIDCYAAFRLRGRDELAVNIRRWLDHSLRGTKLPLDLYSWRVLAYGREAVGLLDVPEHDLRYRKTLRINGRSVSGFYDSADLQVNNIWLDGLGHMACAYLLYGDRQRGFFYANQLDAFIFEKEIGGELVHALPYAANRAGNYHWIDPQAGFVSAGAWYIFAKNAFNPFTLEQVSPKR